MTRYASRTTPRDALRVRTCPACRYQVPVSDDGPYTCPNCEELVMPAAARALPHDERRRLYLASLGRAEAPSRK